MLFKRILFVIVLGAVLCVPSGARSEDNKTLVRRWIEEVLSKGNVAAVGDFLASTYVGHSPGVPDAKGPEGIKQRLTALRTAFPDLRYNVEDMVAEGDKVSVRYVAHGTQKGDYMGVAPTGKEMTWTAIGILHITNGKFQEGWLMSDLGQQLRMFAGQGQGKP
jgi:steroid delta-isomerase-like uncharacterized protein